MTFVPPSIEESGGLKPHVDKGIDEQNGHGYDDLINYVGDDPAQPLMPISKMARLFNKNPKTIRRWLAVMIREMS